MDPRRSRSRASLQAALRSLLAEKAIGDIRVDALCQTAGVTRPTFYANYGSVQALLDEYLTQMLDALRQRIEARAPDTGPQVPAEEKYRRTEQVLAWFFDVVGTDDPRMRCLLTEGPAARVEEPFVALFRDILETRSARDPEAGWQPAPVREVALRFFSGALVALLRGQLTAPAPLPSRELAQLAARLMTFGRAGPSPDQGKDQGTSQGVGQGLDQALGQC